MFWAIGKKEGFHEDEMFSYGASNSTLGSTFITYGRIDNLDTIVKDKNPFLTIQKRIFYYFHQDEYSSAEKDLGRDDFKSVWRTREDATEYLQIDNFEEAIDFFTVYWNTAKDVHPPLFYFAVHIASILFWGHFSKYIIFIVNLLFFYGTIHFLRKILELIGRKELTIPNLIFYGASIGAISTVIFQRMYMMLTFFTIWFLYINLKIYINSFELDKKLKRQLIVVTILGFLTQYNFCIYAAFVALVMIGISIYKKNKKFILKYIVAFIIAAIIGVLIFLPSIYHIFFSYRGGGRSERGFTTLEALKALMERGLSAYSLAFYFGVGLSISLILIFIWKFIKSNSKGIYLILLIPAIFTFLAIGVISPYKSLRYIMFLLPIFALFFIVLLDELIDSKKFSCIFLTIFAIYISVYGIATQKINYLYEGYNDYLKIADEYQDDRFVLVMPTVFSQIQDVPEFKIYKESLIIAPDRLEDLETYSEFEQEDEFIVGIKNWNKKPIDAILDEIVVYTGFENYELVYSSDESANMTIYRFFK